MCTSCAAGAILFLLAGCGDQTPKGQVLARVNGDEITAAELSAEARARGISTTDPDVRNALLGDLVDRKLLVRQARNGGFDRSPDYILASRRSDEILLTQQLLAAASSASAPSAADVAQYVAQNPQAFAGRTLVTVDQLSFPSNSGLPPTPAGTAAPTLEQLQQQLAAKRIAAQRSVASWNTSDLSPAAGKALMATAIGQDFRIEDGGRVFVGKVLAKIPQPVPPAQQDIIAKSRIAQLRSASLLEQLAERARAGAKVEYQPGFDPDQSAN